jgi:hypothetical protein
MRDRFAKSVVDHFKLEDIDRLADPEIAAVKVGKALTFNINSWIITILKFAGVDSLTRSSKGIKGIYFDEK